MFFKGKEKIEIQAKIKENEISRKFKPSGQK